MFDPKGIKLIASQTSGITIGGVDQSPLFDVWAQRAGATRGTYTFAPYTQELMYAEQMASGEVPGGFSDRLDAVDRINGIRWTTIPCWKVEGGAENYERSYKESYTLFNAYITTSESNLQSYQDRLIAMGYPEELVRAIPLMIDTTPNYWGDGDYD